MPDAPAACTRSKALCQAGLGACSASKEGPCAALEAADQGIKHLLGMYGILHGVHSQYS